MALAAVAGLTSCQADMDAPELVAPVATMQANTTILELKTAFENKTELVGWKDADTETPYIIHGRVISSDATGNIYKSLVIQDETAALTFSVNQGSTYTDYPIGQEVVVNVTGLYMGYYRGLQQIGWLSTPYDDTPQLGFMAWDLFLGHSEKNGFPNPDVKYVTQDGEWPSDSPYCIVTSFDQLPSAGTELMKMQSQLVEFRNVYFEDGGKDTYAPYQESVSRNLKNASGGSLVVRNSGYSNFYNEVLPEGSGTVRGILSYYSTGTPTWQLLLRGTWDVMITDKGQKADPYTVAEAISEDVQNQGMSGWVTAYIVGSVKAGVQKVTSNDDIIFGANAEMDNNLILAGTPDETDWTKCIAVALPQGSSFREKCNLADNPGVYKKSILVNGILSTLYGMPGIVDNGGTGNDVEVEGVEIAGGSTAPTGAGTVESPFNCEQAVQMCIQNGEESTVQYYTAGYIINIKEVDTGSYGNAIFTIADNPEGTGTTLYVYHIYDLGNKKFTDANKIKVGDKVVICTALINYKGNTPETSKGYIYSINGETGSEGDTPGTGDEPSGDVGEVTGDGTEDNPYSIAAVLQSTADATGVWVEGYVAGYCAGSTWDTAVFGTEPSTETNYLNATNCILSAVAPTGSDANNSIACGLKKVGDVRQTLGIVNNPDIYGKKVRVKGDMTTYFQHRGIKNVTEYKILD